jgi:hypothetical protein
VLLLVAAVLLLVAFYLPNSGESVYTGFGSIDAQQTALAMYAFKLLFFGVPVLLLLFVGWSVGESFARERWGDRLAAFDALLSRDLRNATVGRAILLGALAAPALAAVALLPGGSSSRRAWPTVARHGHRGILLSVAGRSARSQGSFSALLLTVVPILFLLAWANRRRALPLGFALLAVAGAGLADAGIPLDPLLPRLLANAAIACAAGALFLYADLLAAAIALVGANLLLGVGPYALVTLGPARTQALVALAVPFAILLVLAATGLATGRYVTYTYEDLAPHVKRIVERERVKAEIDAANRIQSALLPSKAPEIRGAEVASHYQAATEIGGDYFDFLPLPGGRLGIAFGDVAGHGLTSGIVMAMAKSALLVQIGYDASPTRVLEVLNDIVMKTAPKRMLMTFFFGVLDPDRQVLRFSSAGHLDPFVFRASTGQIEALSAWGFPLGVRRREPFREWSRGSSRETASCSSATGSSRPWTTRNRSASAVRGDPEANGEEARAHPAQISRRSSGSRNRPPGRPDAGGVLVRRRGEAPQGKLRRRIIPGMTMQVTTGATLLCTFGAAPSSLIVIPKGIPVTAGGPPRARSWISRPWRTSRRSECACPRRTPW